MTDTEPRYIVTLPVENGYSWWDVVDRLSPIYPNFKLASFFAGISFAEEAARDVCDRLNSEAA